MEDDNLKLFEDILPTEGDTLANTIENILLSVRDKDIDISKDISEIKKENKSKGIDDSYLGNIKVQSITESLFEEINPSLEYQKQVRSDYDYLPNENYEDHLLLQSQLTGVPIELLMEGLNDSPVHVDNSVLSMLPTANLDEDTEVHEDDLNFMDIPVEQEQEHQEESLDFMNLQEQEVIFDLEEAQNPQDETLNLGDLKEPQVDLNQDFEQDEVLDLEDLQEQQDEYLDLEDLIESEEKELDLEDVIEELDLEDLNIKSETFKIEIEKDYKTEKEIDEEVIPVAKVGSINLNFTNDESDTYSLRTIDTGGNSGI